MSQRGRLIGFVMLLMLVSSMGQMCPLQGPMGPMGLMGLPGEQGSVGFTLPPIPGERGPQGEPGEDVATHIISTVAELRVALQDNVRILVREGQYLVNETIDVNFDNVTIEGAGNATVFTLADGAERPVFVIGEPTPFQPSIIRRNIVIRNLRVDGNRANQSTELSTAPGRSFLRNNCITLREVEDCLVENVTVVAARSGGIVLEQTCTNVVLCGVIAEDCEFDGIAWDGLITNSRIESSTCRNNLAAGLSFDIGPRGNLIIDSFFIANGSVGMFIRDSRENLFANCFISDNVQDGVFIADGDASGAAATGNYFNANFIVDNGRNGIWQAGSNSVNNVVDGGFFCRNGMNPTEESFPALAPLITFDLVICP